MSKNEESNPIVWPCIVNKAKKKTEKRTTKKNILEFEEVKTAVKLIFWKIFHKIFPLHLQNFRNFWPKEILINSFVVQNLIFVCCRLVEV
jgi:hypothetical protein